MSSPKPSSALDEEEEDDDPSFPVSLRIPCFEEDVSIPESRLNSEEEEDDEEEKNGDNSFPPASIRSGFSVGSSSSWGG